MTQAYVGAVPTTGDFKKLDSITTSSATTFNLRQGGVAVYPQSANHCIVSLNGVIQAPVDAFTIVNDTIVFASSLASSDVINFILVLGNVNDIGVPSDDTVSTAKLQANAVTSAKIASGVIPTLRSNAKPIMVNGNFELWQRGTSFTTSVYTADRWKQDLSGASATVSRQTFTVGQSDVPNNPKYHLRQTVSTANNNCGIFYRHEDVTTLTGNITISFYAKGTNPNGGNLHIITKQDFGSGGSTAVETSTQNLTLSGSWQQFVFNFSLASISGKTVGANSYLQILIKQPDGDASTNAWTLDLANFQVEDDTYTSSTLPPFQHESYQENYDRCIRYYYRLTPTTGFRYAGWGQVDNDDNVILGITWFKTHMRTPPSALEQSGTASHYKVREATTVTCDAVPTFTNADTWYAATSFKKSGITSSNGFAQGEPLKVGIDGGYLGWSAEL